MRAATILCLTLLTSACAAIQPTDSELTGRGFSPEGQKREAAALWCYRTIGRPDCYPAPIPSEAHRLIEGGPQPPAPMPLGDEKSSRFGHLVAESDTPPQQSSAPPSSSPPP